MYEGSSKHFHTFLYLIELKVQNIFEEHSYITMLWDSGAQMNKGSWKTVFFFQY